MKPSERLHKFCKAWIQYIKTWRYALRIHGENMKKCQYKNILMTIFVIIWMKDLYLFSAQYKTYNTLNNTKNLLFCLETFFRNLKMDFVLVSKGHHFFIQMHSWKLCLIRILTEEDSKLLLKTKRNWIVCSSHSMKKKFLQLVRWMKKKNNK